MDISAPMAILLLHGEVPCILFLISRRSSDSVIFIFVRSSLEPLITFQYYPFSFITFYPSF
jgi:hypothetical protein